MGIDTEVFVEGLPLLGRGLLNTVIYCAMASAMGMVLAIGIALCRLSSRRILRWPSLVFVEALRNTPFLVQAFLVYFGLAKFGIRLSPPVAGVAVLTCYAAANFSEAFRGAFLSVSQGQFEAARALGIPYFTTIRRVVLPQTLAYLIPSLTNQTIGIVKDSAALSVITVPELAMAAQMLVGQTFRPIESYMMLGALYWLLTSGIVAGAGLVERSTMPRREAAPIASPRTAAAGGADMR